MNKQIKTIFILFGLTIVSPILHNVFYACFKTEEPVFFILTFIFALGFIVSIIYSLVSVIKNKLQK